MERDRKDEIVERETYGRARRENFDEQRGRRMGSYQPAIIPATVEIYTNFFELVKKPDWHLYQYHVDFEPPTENKRLKTALVKTQNVLKNSVFDGSTLFTTLKFDKTVTILSSVNPFDKTAYKIIIKKTADIYPSNGKFEIDTLQKAMSLVKIDKDQDISDHEITKNKDEITTDFIRFLNLIFKNCLKQCGFVESGRDRAYFDFKKTTPFEKYRLIIANGYKASIEIYNNKLLLCSEISYRLINVQTVLDLMSNTYERVNRDIEKLKEECIKDIVGQTVMTRYNNRNYKVDGISFDLSPTSEFETKRGPVSFIEYYNNSYNVKIKDHKQPLLVSKPKDRDKRGGRTQLIYLIPELCAITGGNCYKVNDFNFKRDLDSITKLNCRDRYKKVVGLIDTINNKPEAKSELKKWDMGFSNEVIKFQSRVIAQDTMFFANSLIDKVQQNGWNTELQKARHISTIPLKNWVIFYMPREQDISSIVKQEIMELSKPMGFLVNEPRLIRLPESRGRPTDTFAQAIKTELKRNQNIQMVVCITPNNAKDTYDAIKRICCIEYGVPSQVITSSKLKKNVKSVMTKVTIQLCCKLGGEIWGLKIPLKSIMVVGIDVYTDTSSKNKRTVTAFVSSMNSNVTLAEQASVKTTAFTRWFSKCMMESTEQKYSDWINTMMFDAIKKYHEKNGMHPENIFVYRDGLNENEFEVLKEIEIERMKEAFKLIDVAYNPKLTVIVVQKRNNARFFMKSGNELTNPFVGTVVDDHVVKEHGKDFYLISQITNQGTVNPTHYHVIEGLSNLSFERLQILTYKLTHLYFNWSGNIRVPAPCHYAHKLAFLVANSLHEPHHSSLDEVLFYI